MTPRLLAGATVAVLTLVAAPAASGLQDQTSPPARVAAAPTERAAAPKVTPARPIAGETTVVRGRAPGGARPVVLQRRAGKHWVRVTRARTSTKGAYAIRSRARSAATTYRVSAPRARTRGHVVKSWRSRPFTVRAVAQQVTLTIPATVAPGTRIRATVTARPVRAGRAVLVQRRVGTAWQTVGRGTQGTSGVVAVTVTTASSGTSGYRAQVVGRRGAPTVSSATRVVTIAPAAPTGVAYRVLSFSGEEINHATQGRICTQGIGGKRTITLSRTTAETGRPQWKATTEPDGTSVIEVWPAGTASMVSDLSGCENPGTPQEKLCQRQYRDPNLTGNWGVHAVVRIPKGASHGTVMFFPGRGSVGYQGAGNSLCNVEEIIAPTVIGDGLRTIRVPVSTLLGSRPFTLTSTGSTSWSTDLLGRAASITAGWTHSLRLQRVTPEGRPLG